MRTWSVSWRETPRESGDLDWDQPTVAARDLVEGGETKALPGGEPDSERIIPAGDARPNPRRFILRKKIAEGGCGEVWEALQVSLERSIAVKRLKENPPKGNESGWGEWQRREFGFRHEASTAAQLEHPNIVPIYDLGEDEMGRPLLAMKRVRGQQWDTIMREDFHLLRAADFLARHLPILIQAAQAVAFAHSKGVIHRDLKPSQIMIGRFGEVLLMDWGLALGFERIEDWKCSLHYAKMRGAPIDSPINPAGTSSYMAPEQTDESPAGLGPWTDVYLLGGVLYRLLTGRCPHSAPDSKTAFLLAREGNVLAPEEISPNREIPGELSILAMKSLARPPRGPHGFRGSVHRRIERVSKRLGQAQGIHGAEFAGGKSSGILPAGIRPHRRSHQYAGPGADALAGFSDFFGFTPASAVALRADRLGPSRPQTGSLSRPSALMKVPGARNFWGKLESRRTTSAARTSGWPKRSARPNSSATRPHQGPPARRGNASARRGPRAIPSA